jgi:cysteinyl-tRNA synthetase
MRFHPLRAFSGKVDTGFPQKMRPLKDTNRWQRDAAFGRAWVLGRRLAAVSAGAIIALALWSGDWEATAEWQPDRAARAAGSDHQGSTVPPMVPSSVQVPALGRPSATPPAPAPEVTGALEPTDGAPRSIAPPSPSARPVRSWRYQLQNIDPDELANSSADLVVVDYSGDDGPFSKAQVERMKQKPDGSRRIVLSYMSIGEAESYRWYWSQRSSSWLGRENPQWRGNYGVRFWDPAWQEIIFSYTDRILAAGFDGVYLDKIDQFEDMGHREDMVEFVARISARAKAQQSDLLVIAQNGDHLLADAKFRHVIDGFAREDLFYGEDTDGARNAESSIRESVERLKTLAVEGKPVFVVEYPRNDEQARTAWREISEQGFLGLMARRSLSVP